MADKMWYGSKVCDFCKRDVSGIKFVDGKTVHGPWALMCMDCYRDHGMGFGTGRGQQYDETGKKIAG
jgi:hypothetical protein